MGKAFEEWKSLFAESAVNVWTGEREELRKATMLIHILGLELTRIKKLAEAELDGYRKQFDAKSTKENKFLSPNKVLPRRQSFTQRDNKNCDKTPLTSINSSDRFKQSHVSPDLFNLESPDLSKHKNPTEPVTDEDEIISTQILHVSPKINRRRYLRLKKNKETARNSLSGQRASEKKTPENVNVLEIVDDTPEVSHRKAKSSVLKLQNRTGKEARVRLFNNTLTQMYPNIPSGIKNKKEKSDSQSVEVDSDATTICEIQEDFPALNSAIDVDTVRFEDDGLSQFLINYDKVPERKKTVPEAKEEKCKKCTKRGLCPKHRETFTQEHKTFTGFWDIDFTVDDPMEESQTSTFF